MKAWNADKILKELNSKLENAKRSKDKPMEVFASGCKMILQELPTVDVADVITCSKCFFYSRKTYKCTHKNGLLGRVRPEMYCSYGSVNSYEDLEDDEDDFSEFEEDING